MGDPSRVLVSGAAGFIGRPLVERLTGAGCEVHAVDRDGGAVSLEAVPHACDIRDAEAVRAAVRAARPEVAFHLAAWKERQADLPAFHRALDVNLTGSLNLLTALLEEGTCRRVVVVGTAEEYGIQACPFTERMREAPVSAYSYSKACVTLLCETLERLHGLPYVLVRPTLAYGPGQPPEMFVPALVAALAEGRRFPMTAGDQTRDFVYVDDVVGALLAAGTAPGVDGRKLNVGSGDSVTLADVARTVAELTGRPDLLGLGELSYRPSEVMEYSVDTSLARELLSWVPRVRLDEGLRRTVAAALGGE